MKFFFFLKKTLLSDLLGKWKRRTLLQTCLQGPGERRLGTECSGVPGREQVAQAMGRAHCAGVEMFTASADTEPPPAPRAPKPHEEVFLKLCIADNDCCWLLDGVHYLRIIGWARFKYDRVIK